jgi:Bacterial Ig-like domain (group 3)
MTMFKIKVSFALVLLSSSVCSYAQAGAAAVQHSTTTLTISPRHADIGTPVMLTAMVQFGVVPVRHGSIVFCDAMAARCQGLGVLGSAQLTSSGTASVKLTLGAGAYSIKSVFQGTPRSAPPVSSSASAAQTLTIDNNSKALLQKRSKHQ